MGLVWAEVFLFLPQTDKGQAINCKFTGWILWVEKSHSHRVSTLKR